MNPAARNGTTLLILLLAVFPCGAALTVLGSMIVGIVRLARISGFSWDKVWSESPHLFWAGCGVLGFLSLIRSVDVLMMAQRCLRWYVLLGIALGIAAAGYFSATYPLHGDSVVLLRIVCEAPVAIALSMLIHHVFRYVLSRNRSDDFPQVPNDHAPVLGNDVAHH